MVASARDNAHRKKGGTGRLDPSLQCGSLEAPELDRSKGRSLSPACLLRKEAVTMPRFPALDYDYKDRCPWEIPSVNDRREGWL